MEVDSLQMSAELRREIGTIAELAFNVPLPMSTIPVPPGPLHVSKARSVAGAPVSWAVIAYAPHAAELMNPGCAAS